jgi:hypothetical protein
MEPVRKERKPRHRITKGKEREEEAQRHAQAAAAAVDDDKATGDWAWTSLTDNSLSIRPPVFTNDCRYVVVFHDAKFWFLTVRMQILFYNCGFFGENLRNSNWTGRFDAIFI